MKKSLGIIVFLLIALDSLPQDISFTHMNHARLYLNPAFAGNSKVADLTLSHRNFSPADVGNYMTHRASLHQYFDWLHGGLGLQFIRDDQGQGAVSRTYISGMYSYHIRLQKDLTLYGGLEAKYGIYHLNTKDLILPEMFNEWDGLRAISAESRISRKTDQQLGFNAGLVLNHRNEYLRTYRDWTLGLAVRHLNKPASLLNPQRRLPRQYLIYFDIELFLKSLDTYNASTVLIPTFLYARQDQTDRLHYGAYLKYKNLRMGAFIRHDTQLTFITPAFQIGAAFSGFNLDYSYDAGFVNYKKTSVFSGAHEVTLSINLSIRGRRKQ